MRICLLAHNLKGDNGTGVFSARLLRGLREKLGAQVSALTTEGSGSSFEQPILPHDTFKFFRIFPRVRRAIKGCDAVHAIDAYPYGMIAAIATLGLRKKIILTAIGTGSVDFFYNRHWLFTPLVRWSYRRATVVTAISRFTRDLILKHLPDLRVEVINPGVDAENFLPRDDASEEASRTFIVRDSAGGKHAIGSLRPYILSVGSIRWRKGYKRSLKAFATVHRRFPRVKYVIIGKRYSEKYYRELLGIISGFGLERSVLMLDEVDDHAALRALYRNAELFCLLSQHFSYDVEGFGIVFLEAAAAGLPVIGSTESGIEDAIQNGGNGFLVDWRDEKGDLADKIIALLGDACLRSRMSRASLAWASASSWDRRISEYAALYRAVLK